MNDYKYSKKRVLVFMFFSTIALLLIFDLTASVIAIDKMEVGLSSNGSDKMVNASNGECVTVKDVKNEVVYRCYPTIDLMGYEYRTHGTYTEMGFRRTNKSIDNLTGDVNG